MNSHKKIIRSSTVPQSLETFCKGVLKELSEDYDVIALSSPGEALDLIGRREGVRTIAVPMERHISILKDLKSLFALIRVFRNERPDMVHSITPKAALYDGCMVDEGSGPYPHVHRPRVSDIQGIYKEGLDAYRQVDLCLCNAYYPGG